MPDRLGRCTDAGRCDARATADTEGSAVGLTDRLRKITATIARHRHDWTITPSIAGWSVWQCHSCGEQAIG
jgi:hypothetical protein